jgi:hypothetical protein
LGDLHVVNTLRQADRRPIRDSIVQKDETHGVVPSMTVPETEKTLLWYLVNIKVVPHLFVVFQKKAFVDGTHVRLIYWQVYEILQGNIRS